MAQQRQRRRGSIAAIGLLLGLSALIVTVYMIGGSNGGNPEVASDQSEPSAAATDQTSLTRPVDALEAEDVSVPGLLQPREPDQASDSFFALHVADDMGEPISSASVHLEFPGSQALAQTLRTDGRGRVTCPLPEAAVLARVRVVHDGYEAREVTLPVQQLPANHVAEVRLRALVEMQGRVVVAAGLADFPLSLVITEITAPVLASPFADAPEELKLQTDARGAFGPMELPRGARVRLRVQDLEGADLGVFTRRVASGSESWTLTLEGQGTLTVYITDDPLPSGAPDAPVDLVLRRNGSAEVYARAGLREGTAELSGIDMGGLYDVSLESGGYFPGLLRSGLALRDVHTRLEFGLAGPLTSKSARTSPYQGQRWEFTVEFTGPAGRALVEEELEALVLRPPRVYASITSLDGDVTQDVALQLLPDAAALVVAAAVHFPASLRIRVGDTDQEWSDVYPGDVVSFAVAVEAAEPTVAVGLRCIDELGNPVLVAGYEIFDAVGQSMPFVQPLPGQARATVDLPPGAYSAHTMALNGLITAPAHFDVLPAMEGNDIVILAGSPAAVELSLVGSEPDDQVSACYAEVTPAGGIGKTTSVSIDRDGNGRIEGLAPGRYRVSALRSGGDVLTSASQDIELFFDDDMPIRLDLASDPIPVGELVFSAAAGLVIRRVELILDAEKMPLVVQQPFYLDSPLVVPAGHISYRVGIGDETRPDVMHLLRGVAACSAGERTSVHLVAP